MVKFVLQFWANVVVFLFRSVLCVLNLPISFIYSLHSIFQNVKMIFKAVVLLTILGKK